MIDSITLLRAEAAGLPAAESHPDAPLVCFPLRIDWEASSEYQAPVEPYPVPSAVGHFVTVEAWPQPVKSLVAWANASGWSALVTRAVGTMPHASYGTPTTEKESFAVRMAHGSRRAVAVRRGTAWDSFWTWGPEQFFTRHGTLEAFKQAIA